MTTRRGFLQSIFAAAGVVAIPKIAMPEALPEIVEVAAPEHRLGNGRGWGDTKGGFTCAGAWYAAGPGVYYGESFDISRVDRITAVFMTGDLPRGTEVGVSLWQYDFRIADGNFVPNLSHQAREYDMTRVVCLEAGQDEMAEIYWRVAPRIDIIGGPADVLVNVLWKWPQ